MKRYVCTICGYIYDEAAGIPNAGIPAGTKWEDLPADWKCPLCGADKSDFKEQVYEKVSEPGSEENRPEAVLDKTESYQELSVGELSALCSNLARGCEKQYLNKESGLFTQLAEYFQARAPKEPEESTKELLSFVQKNLEEDYPNANQAANAAKDRGALRALVWNEKVTRILNSLLSRYENEGTAFLENTNVYVCTICGFIYIGDNPPKLCPVCKVPDWKFEKIERRA